MSGETTPVAILDGELKEEKRKWEEILKTHGIDRFTATSRNIDRLNQPGTKTILCLSGFTETGEDTFGGIADQLATDPNIVVIMISTPGSSETTFTAEALKDEMAYTAKDYAELVQAYMRSQGIVPDVVIGHSLGGRTAMLMNCSNKILLAPAFEITQDFSIAVGGLIRLKERNQELTSKIIRLLQMLLGFVPEGYLENIQAIPAQALKKVRDGLKRPAEETTLRAGENVYTFYSRGHEGVVDTRRGLQRRDDVGKDEIIKSVDLPGEVTAFETGGHNCHLVDPNQKVIVGKIKDLLK